MNIGNIFTQTLGRGPTAEEAEYFGGMIERGEIQPVEMLYFLQGTPEVQQQALQQLTSRGMAQRVAQAYDIATFPQFRQQAISQYAKMGRQSTTAIDVALAKEMAKLSLQRSQMFAGMPREDVLSNIGYGRQTAATGREQAYQTQYQQRGYEQQRALADLQNQYNVALAQLQRKWAKQDQPSFFESLVPGLVSGGFSLGAAGITSRALRNMYA